MELVATNRNNILQNPNLTSGQKHQMLQKLNKIRRKKLSKLHDKQQRENILGTSYNDRTIQIASMNVDSLRTAESIHSTIHNISNNNIDIACIQETHTTKEMITL